MLLYFDIADKKLTTDNRLLTTVMRRLLWIMYMTKLM